MNSLSQPGFFDLSDRYEQLSQAGDPLERLNKLINWKIFLPLIEKAFFRERRSEAGRKPYDRLLMFKILVIQGLYNLSDHQVEFQIRDRLSFMRFLGLNLEDKVPDEKTLWSFREVLVQGRMMKKLFTRFDRYLERQGLEAKVGHIIDASIIEVPKQRNSRDDNQTIKEGDVPESFKENPNKLRQKDIDARWAVKGQVPYYGYKDHINIDVKHKIIRSYEVTSAAEHDKWELEDLLKAVPQNDKKVWADGAYFSEEQEKRLKKKGYESRIIKRTKNFPAHSAIVRENSRRSKIRKHVEHIFGFIENSMHGKFIRTIGIARASLKIGFMNLIYNFCRYEQICRIGAS